MQRRSARTRARRAYTAHIAGAGKYCRRWRITDSAPSEHGGSCGFLGGSSAVSELGADRCVRMAPMQAVGRVWQGRVWEGYISPAWLAQAHARARPRHRTRPHGAAESFQASDDRGSGCSTAHGQMLVPKPHCTSPHLATDATVAQSTNDAEEPAGAPPILVKNVPTSTHGYIRMCP